MGVLFCFLSVTAGRLHVEENIRKMRTSVLTVRNVFLEEDAKGVCLFQIILCSQRLNSSCIFYLCVFCRAYKRPSVSLRFVSTPPYVEPVKCF